MELTVVLTNYRRPANVRTVLASLARQTLPHRLFVWDNSPEQDFAGSADWVIRSSRNAQCTPRWWLAAQADTPWVLVADDDLVPDDDRLLGDVIEQCIHLAPSALGASGVQLDLAKSYGLCRHVGCRARPIRNDTSVDILKGRFFAVARQRLEKLPYMPLGDEDDIAVSSVLGGGVVLAMLQHRLRELPTGREAWSRRDGHLELREIARRRWFATGGNG